MKYRVRDIICVKVKNEEFVPYVFNNNGSKLQNLLTNEIIDLNESMYETLGIDSWLLRYDQVHDVCDKVFGKCIIRDLEHLVIDTVRNYPLWMKTHENFVGKIEKGCDLPWPSDSFVSDTQVKSLVKVANRFLKREPSKQVIKDEKNQKLNNEVEQSHEF